MKRIVLAMPVVHEDNKVGTILAILGAIAVRHLESKVVILHVGLNTRMRLGHAAELGLPITVENHIIDLAAACVRLPTVGLRSVELHVAGRASWVVGVRDYFDRRLPQGRAGDSCGN